jgi:hypothetical protein
MKYNYLKFGLFSASMAAVLAFVSSAHGETLVSEDFNTGVTFTDWYWTGGSFQNPPSFNEAWNQSSTANQFFTTSFTPTSLAVGDSMLVTFQYNPNSLNINTVRVGLFSGTAATSNGWAQFVNATAPSSTWTGYIGNLAIGSGNSIASLKGTSGDHPFFGAPTASSSAATSFGTGAVRAAGLTLERTIDSMVLTLSEGATLGTLSPVVSFTDSTSAITDFNLLSFYATTSDASNGDMRYDTVRVVVVPEPSTYAVVLPGAVCALVTACRIRRRSRPVNV